MNTKRTVLSALIVLSTTYLTGCIGSSESECPGVENGVICKGPREVMELTNNRDDLFDTNGEQTEGKGESTVADSRYPAQVTPPGEVQYPKSPALINKPVATTITPVALSSNTISPRPIGGTPVSQGSVTRASGNPFNNTPVQATPAPRYYNPNSDIKPAKDLYSVYNGQPVNPTLSQNQVQQYRSQGYKQPVVAPEPLAVLQQGKVMRITFAPYTDDNNALNLPGYVYVNVRPQTWIAGNNATTNPARIVPLEVQDSARENMQLQQKATKAVTANGVVREL